MKNDDSYQIVADLKKSIWNHKTVLGICAVSGHPQLVLSPSLNTQSCNRRPLCSTFRFENLSISPKKPVFSTFSTFFKKKKL